MRLVFLAVPLLHSLVAATSRPARHACKDFLIPISVTAPFYQLNFAIETNWDVIDYIFNSTRRDSHDVFQPIIGNRTVTATYTVGATFCTPATPGRFSQTVLLLTHGSMVDRR